MRPPSNSAAPWAPSRRRLEDGRNRLRSRLARRGVALAAGFTLALSDSALPAALIEQTMQTISGGP